MLPPLYFGAAMSWRPYDAMKEHICKVEDSFHEAVLNKKKSETVLLSWNVLFNFNELREKLGIRTISIGQFVQLAKQAKRSDTYYIRDRVRKTHRYYDDIPFSKPMAVFDNLVGREKEEWELVEGTKSILNKVKEIEVTKSMKAPNLWKAFEITSLLKVDPSKPGADDGYTKFIGKTVHKVFNGEKHALTREFIKSPNEFAESHSKLLSLPTPTTSNENEFSYKLPLTPFEHIINLKAMQPRGTFLIHLGSVFGSGRIQLFHEHHKQLVQQISSLLIPRIEVLETIADQIQNYLESLQGPMTIGMHIRLGDGQFERSSGTTMKNTEKKLKEAFEELSQGMSSRKKFSIYIATDVPRPRENPAYRHLQRTLKQLRKEYPLIQPQLFFLEDFYSTVVRPQIKGMHDYIKDILSSQESVSVSTENQDTQIKHCGPFMMKDLYQYLDKPNSQKHPLLNTTPKKQAGDLSRWTCDQINTYEFEKHFIALLDMSIVSRSKIFWGTKGSTFSGYVKRQWMRYWDEKNGGKLVDVIPGKVAEQEGEVWNDVDEGNFANNPEYAQTEGGQKFEETLVEEDESTTNPVTEESEPSLKKVEVAKDEGIWKDNIEKIAARGEMIPMT